MRAFINGVEKNPNVNLFKEADDNLNVALMNDDGSPVDITADAVAIEVQSSKARATAVKDLNGVLHAAPSSGHFTVKVEPTGGGDNVMDFGPGTYYLFPYRVEDVSGDKHYADGFATLTVS